MAAAADAAAFESRAIEREHARRNPVALASNRTETQIKADLSRIKCDDETWSAVRVVPAAAPNRFNIVPRVLDNDGETLDIPDDAPLTKGRLRKRLSAHAQVFSWLRANDWDMRRPRGGVPNILAWAREEFRVGLLAPGHGMSAAQVRGLPPSLRRFRTTLTRSVGHSDAFAKFTTWINTVGLMGGVGSLLPAPSTLAFASHLCAFAQLVKITKTLYVQVLVMKAKMNEIRTIAVCNKPGVVGSQPFLKRLRGIWGLFHHTCMPAIVYIRAWTEYFGLRLHGTPYGPLFWLNLWAYYVRNALLAVEDERRRKAVKDARKLITLEQISVRDFREVLDAVTLHTLIRTSLRAPLSAARKALADDMWVAEQERPAMPGPPPEYTREFSLENGWGAYLESLPENWRVWLGTHEAGARYRQYEHNEEAHRLSTGVGTDVEKSVMFRFGGGACLVPRPARRSYLNPPAQRAVRPYLYREPGLVDAAHAVQMIAEGGGGV